MEACHNDDDDLFDTHAVMKGQEIVIGAFADGSYG